MTDDVSPLELHVLERMLRDLEGPGLRSLADYEQMFDGFEPLVRSCYERMRAGPPAAESSSAPQQSAPQQLGPFVLLEVAGRGGQGTVWRARDERLGRTVAVKVLSTQIVWSDDDTRRRLRARFEREAVAAARIEDPGICGVHEIGEHNGVPWIAMQWVRGTSLDRVVAACRERSGRPGPIAHDALGVDAGVPGRVRAVAALLATVARSVHQAHLAGLVHRDLKPGNLMLTPEGRGVVLDFGLAFDDQDDAMTLTRSGDAMGSPAYMSPEQLDGGPVDRRCDVYALGVTLYECLATRRPFEEQTRERLFRAIRLGERPPLRSLVPDISADLAQVVACATDPDRDRRYESALELAEDLERAACGDAVHARPPGVAVRAVRWVRSSPLLAGMLLVLLLLAATVAIVQRLESGKLRAKNLELEQREQEARWGTHLSSMRLAAMHVERSELGEAAAALEGCPDEHRGFVWKHLQLRTDESERELPGGWVFAASDNGRHLISYLPNGDVEVRDGADGALRTRWSAGATKVLAAAISSNGDVAALGLQDRTVRVVDARSGAELQSFGPFVGWIARLEMHAEGRQIAVLLSAETERGLVVRVLDRVDGKVRPDAPVPASRMAFVSSEQLVVANPRKGVDLVDVRTGATETLVPWHVDREFQSLAVAPGGGRMAFASWNGGDIEIHDRRSGEVVRCSGEHRVRIVELRFVPSGNRLLSVDGSGLACLWDVARGTLLRRLRGVTGNNVGFSADGLGLWVPDEKRLRYFALGEPPAERLLGPGYQARVGGDGATVHVLDRCSVTSVNTGTGAVRGVVRRRVEYTASCTALAEAGGDAWFAVGYQDGRVELCDVARFEHQWLDVREATWTDPSGRQRKAGVSGMAFSHGGKRLCISYQDGALRTLDVGSGVEVASVVLGERVQVLGLGAGGALLYLKVGYEIVAVDPSQPSVVVDRLPFESRALVDAVSADGTRLASANMQTGVLTIWDLQARRRVIALPESRHGTQTVAFGPDGCLLATSSADRTVRFWDLRTGSVLAEMAYEGNVICAGFAPDGGRLVCVRDGVRVLETARPDPEQRAARRRLEVCEQAAHRVLGATRVDYFEEPWTFLDEVARTVADPGVRDAVGRLMAEASPHPMPAALVARTMLLEPARGSNRTLAHAWSSFACDRWPHDAGFAATRALDFLRRNRVEEARGALDRAQALSEASGKAAGWVAGVRALLAVAARDEELARRALAAARQVEGYEFALPLLLAEVERALGSGDGR